METINLGISGMSCKNCSNKIEAGLMEMLGVAEARVDLANDSAQITFNPKKTSRRSIEKKISSLGYSVTGSENNGDSSLTKKTLLQGIIYGLVPHIGCIGFVVASILGVTFAAELFRPLLQNALFFYLLIALSLFFATISSYIYLQKNDLLSWKGIRKKTNYLLVMYGTTIGVSLLFLFVIFPLLVSVSYGPQEKVNPVQVASGVIDDNNSRSALTPQSQAGSIKSITLQVQIPCAGHSPLIVSELKKLVGVESVSVSAWDTFVVSFDSTKTSVDSILGARIFKDYPAKLE
jgi:copper chaperone CopZ